MSSTPYQQTASDGAIESYHQDDFHRRDFAIHLANAILARRGQNSFVVSLQGAWGCGKTSVKNMALEELSARSNAPEIVEFEPWQLRDADSLFAAFFGEIALKITGKEAADSKKRLEAYSKSLTIGGSTLKYIGILAGILGVPLAKVIELMGEKMGDAANVAKQGAEATPDKSLSDQKSELSELLRKLDRPILVVIDDIDRLEVAEMLLIFQLIKANADFPNFTYLLLMHRERVQDALDDRLGSYSSDYLEKIVQLPIDVPPANSAQRYALLKGRIAELLQLWEVPFSIAEQTDLALLWQCGLDELLLQPRDVVRALNAVEFSLAIMIKEKELDVNLADFVALEALRITEATTYTRLPMVKTFLTGRRPQKESEKSQTNYPSPNSQPANDEQPGEAEMSAALLALSVHEVQGRAARRVLAFLFPSSSWALGTQKRTMWEVTPTRPPLNWRINDERYFERYFNLAIPQDQISQSEITRFIRALPDKVALMAHLEDLKMRGLHQTFLLELYQHHERVSSQYVADFLAVQLDFWEKHGYYPLLDTLFDSVFVVILEIEHKSELLRAILEKTEAYAIPALWLRRQEDMLKDLKRNRQDISAPYYDHRHYWTDQSGWEQARDLVVERIKRHNNTPDFWKGRITLECVILWFSVEPEEVRKWVSEQSATDEQLPFFLLHFSDCGLYNSNAPETFGHIQFVREVSDWIEDLPALRARVEALDPSALDKTTQLLRTQFLGFSEVWLKQQAEAANSDMPEDDEN